jgi:4-amino-4-deoxy-L-arabinose transferase-like glycosyltransferase
MRATESQIIPQTASLWQRACAGIERRVWPASVLALGLGSFLLWLPYLDAPLDVDVGTYATVAYWWARGDTLYEGLTTDRPQGIFVVFRLIEALGLGSLRGIHLFAALYAAACTLALLMVARRVWGRAIGFGAAAIFALVMATPYLQGPTANAELFMLLPLLLSLDLLLRADDRPLGGRSGNGFLFASGFLGAIALLLKPPAIAVVALGALWLARRWRAEGATWRALARAELSLLAGLLAGLVPAIAHGLSSAPDRYLYAIFLYRFSALSAASTPLGTQLGSLIQVVIYIATRYPLLLLAPVGFAALRREPRQRGLLALWLLTSLGGAAIGGNWFPHYFQQLLPPIAVAVALALRALFGALPASASLLRRAYPLLRVYAVLCAFYLLALVGIILAPTGDARRLVIDQTRTPGAISTIADYLRANTASDERIYVAYGQGDIYYLAQRRPAARWLHTNEIRRIPGAFDEQLILLTDPATAPRYILAAQPFDYRGLDPHGALRAVVASQYTLETTIDGIPIYRRRD